MSLSPWVSVDHIIDNKSSPQKVVDFLNAKNINNITLSLGSFSELSLVAADDIDYGIDPTSESYYYQDLVLTDSEAKNILTVNHIPFVFIKSSTNKTTDRDNFPTCKVYYKDNQTYLRLYAVNQLTEAATIETIVLLEARVTENEKIYIRRGFTNSRAYGNSMAKIEFDKDTFLQYLADLGSISDQVLLLQAFIDSIGESFSTGIITADKITTNGSNLILDFDSFEQFKNKSILGKSLSITSCSVVPNNGAEYEAFHGECALRLVSNNSNNYKYINPKENTNSGWIWVPENGTYIFSFYGRVADASSARSIRAAICTASEEFIVASGSLTDANWNRFYAKGYLTKGYYSIKLKSDNAIPTYFDALQLEKIAEEVKDKVNLPSTFSLAGSVVIDGGNLTANSITADSAVIESLSAEKIVVGRLSSVVNLTVMVQTTSGSPIVTVDSTTRIGVGMAIKDCATIPNGSLVVSVDSLNNTITISENATGNSSGSIVSTFYSPYLSWIDLNTGEFSFGGGRLTYDKDTSALKFTNGTSSGPSISIENDAIRFNMNGSPVGSIVVDSLGASFNLVKTTVESSLYVGIHKVSLYGDNITAFNTV